MVIRLWNEQEPLTSLEKERFSAIKQPLERKGITTLDVKWRTNDDIREMFKKYGILCEVSTGNGLKFKTGDSELISSDNKIILIVRNNKPTSICAGDNGENSFVKPYFMIR